MSKSVNETAEVIGLIFGMAQAWLSEMDVTTDDLDAFESYLGYQNSVLPIVDPSAWRELDQRQLAEAKQRVAILRMVLALPSAKGTQS